MDIIAANEGCRMSAERVKSEKLSGRVDAPEEKQQKLVEINGEIENLKYCVR